MNTEHKELREYIDSLGLVYQATFVPFSASRNAKCNPKINELSINWLISIRSAHSMLTFEYSQGIGHLPKGVAPEFNLRGNLSVDAAKAIRNACEGSKIVVPGKGVKSVKTPDILDVMYCLVMDSDVLETSGFEEWASNFGYDTDSRKAKKIYDQCVEQSLKLKAVLGYEKLEKLRELFQDY